MIAVIGAGRLGLAIARRLAGTGLEVVVTARSEESLRKAVRFGLKAASSNADAVRLSDTVFLAVHPDRLGEVARQVPPKLWSSKWVLSTLAGVPLGRLEKLFPESRVYRVMMNIHVSRGLSPIALAGPRTPEAESKLVPLLSRLGEVEWVEDRQVDLWAALVGAGAAFVAELAEYLVVGGVAAGVPIDDAKRLVAHLLEATGRAMLEGEHPGSLVEQVLTPGGITVQGLLELRKASPHVSRSILEAARSLTG